MDLSIFIERTEKYRGEILAYIQIETEAINYYLQNSEGDNTHLTTSLTIMEYVEMILDGSYIKKTIDLDNDTATFIFNIASCILLGEPMDEDIVLNYSSGNEELFHEIYNLLSIILFCSRLVPITGDDWEWEEIPYDDTGLFTFSYKGTQYDLKVTRCEMNKRNNAIFRFNGSNDYAHCITLCKGITSNNEVIPLKLSDSLRFITFPHIYDNVYVPSSYNDQEVIPAVNLDESIIAFSNNEIVRYILHSRAPLKFIIEKEGTSLGTLVEKSKIALFTFVPLTEKESDKNGDNTNPRN